MGIEFLRNSTPAIYRQNSLNNLLLARHSLAVTHSLRQEINLDYDNAAGHGHLGWTMAAGSGQLLAELICGETPSIDPAAFAPIRFAAGL